MAARLGVDIGGTFTDLVVVDETTGAVRVGKVLTTPGGGGYGSPGDRDLFLIAADSRGGYVIRA